MRERQDLQLWGGIECTVNRVGDRFHDQFSKNGHFERPEDLDRVAELGVRTLRYPVLWERTAPETPRERDWRFADERLARLQSLQIQPIVGLVHHGSGPRYTSLLDESFAPGLAKHARAVAERFPWVEAYTPVNEPLTTARFSALYGHWYPHTTDERSFCRALLNQVRATVLSMEAIRRVNPAARLVQTDDLGKTHSTHRLAYQAEFDNVRRWLTWDLLCGRVDRDHRMWSHFLSMGIDDRELGWFLDHPCPPDVVGVNYYLTSERFLDHRLDRYPAASHGSNGRDEYADVEAVRVLAGGVDGPSALLRETWDRYHLPVAITECHLGCTREEQVRWLGYVWNEAKAAREAGVDVRAVTVWSMFGAHDWCSLLTCDANRYEPGVFDVRAPEPRPTALARAVRCLANGEEPCAEGEGWWERPVRLLYPPVIVERAAGSPAPPRRIEPRPPLMVVGDRAGLARLFDASCELRGIERVLIGADEDDLDRSASARRLLDLHRPWAVLDLRGKGNEALAEACAEIAARLVLISDGSVFEGEKAEPWVESDPIGSGVLAQWERAALRVLPQALVLRHGDFFAVPHEASEDGTLAPTYAPHFVEAALDLLLDGVSGVVHLANEAGIVPAEFARRVASALGGESVRQRSRRAQSRSAGLGSERMWVMPPLEDAIRCAAADAQRKVEQTVGYLA